MTVKYLDFQRKHDIMKIKLSATFEGKCMLCSKDAIVFTAGDEDTKKTVTICKSCSENLGDTPTSDVIEKYGKVDEEPFEGGEIEVKGLGELQKELESKAGKSRRKRTPK